MRGGVRDREGDQKTGIRHRLVPNCGRCAKRCPFEPAPSTPPGKGAARSALPLGASPHGGTSGVSPFRGPRTRPRCAKSPSSQVICFHWLAASEFPERRGGARIRVEDCLGRKPPADFFQILNLVPQHNLRRIDLAALSRIAPGRLDHPEGDGKVVSLWGL